MPLLLQANLNHSVAAQDLCLHNAAEWGVALLVLAEPYAVPSRPDWLGDLTGSAALGSLGARPSIPFSLIGRGEGYVVAEWGEVVVAAVYLPPSHDLPRCERALDGLEALIGPHMGRPVLVAGDFNAKSPEWGSPAADARGTALVEWADTVGLLVLNQGRAPTCVRHNGTSIVDLTFGSPRAARMVGAWRVMVGEETLSDHNYVRFSVSDPSIGEMGRARRVADRDGRPPRWALRKLDRDLFEAAVLVKAWTGELSRSFTDVDEGAAELRGAMHEVCDASMPRSRTAPRRRAAYWWSEDLAALRADCNRARRAWTRCRRRHVIGPDEPLRRAAYTEKCRLLRGAIRRAKAGAWSELLETIDSDPWGRPYHLVRKKLASGGPPVTERLQEQFLTRVVETLFPIDEGVVGNLGRPPVVDPVPWSVDDHGITDEEWAEELKRLRGKNTAPGPDGVPAKALALASGVWGEAVRSLMHRCMETGRFPGIWKEARLVLLPKGGKPPTSPSAYRPICLLDEAGKLLERFVAARLRRHLSQVGPNLATCQYGFREGRSTVDAVLQVRALVEEGTAQGRVCLAVSLDISNAFNTLPWEAIRGALRYHRVPTYLQDVIRDYLGGRYFAYPGRYGAMIRRETRRGVPQGSVLGPLLWNLGYDWVLRGALLPGLAVVCYADDTLLIAREDDWGSVSRLAEVGVAHMVGRVRQLGLKVALEKTEAVWFGRPRSRGPPMTQLAIEGVAVRIRPQMKYLGIILDSKWSFAPHFESLSPRIGAAAAGLARLMPNLGGPGDRARRLYLGVVRSIALYGAPVWHDRVAIRAIAHVLESVQRRMAIRVIRGYRTIPFEAACALSGQLPWALTAGVYTELYRIRVARGGGRPGRATTGRLRRELRTRGAELRQDKLAEWTESLADVRRGLSVVNALRPILDEWFGRGHGSLSYRLVQVLTGHGCFGTYLHRIGREPTAVCHHCGDPEDTPVHTLEFCPAWEDQRRALRDIIGPDVSLPALVRAMVRGASEWEAAVSFAESVMSAKEAAEREREEEPDAPPARRARGGRRRREYLRRLP